MMASLVFFSSQSAALQFLFIQEEAVVDEIEE